MTESLLSPSGVIIFGRVLGGLTLDRDGIPDTKSFLGSRLKADNAKFARIYGFSFEGQYVDIVPPAIFLVHDDGTPAENSADVSGLAFQDETFASGIMMWSYDKDDFTMRLDSSSGTFEDVLLSSELGGGDMGSFAGANARGANARGANARGANARGANARGANARGANARGANARGSSD